MIRVERANCAVPLDPSSQTFGVVADTFGGTASNVRDGRAQRCWPLPGTDLGRHALPVPNRGCVVAAARVALAGAVGVGAALVGGAPAVEAGWSQTVPVARGAQLTRGAIGVGAAGREHAPVPAKDQPGARLARTEAHRAAGAVVIDQALIGAANLLKAVGVRIAAVGLAIRVRGAGDCSSVGSR
jgi:hypothetical protein